MKKTIFTLNIDNYSPEITEITYPLIKFYANKIGARFHVIKERKFPDFPVTYEKLQIFKLAQEMKNDWNIFIDSDALINPDSPDWTAFLNKDTVAHNGTDLASIRWKYDRHFLRDGRHVGSCNWFTIASDLCIDLWHPLDITVHEAVSNIFPTLEELNSITTAEHLIDDYTVSRNIAKYGLKTDTIRDIQARNGIKNNIYFWHIYNVANKDKAEGLKQVVEAWKVPDHIRHYGK